MIAITKITEAKIIELVDVDADMVTKEVMTILHNLMKMPTLGRTRV